MQNRIIFTTALLLMMQAAISQEKNTTQDSTRPSTIQEKDLSPDKMDDLFVLGKVWGFLKYFHPQVASGRFDWDKKLIDFLPGYLQTKTKKERNDSLLAWVEGLGEIPSNKAGSYQSIKEYKIGPDFSWISSKNFGEALKRKLNYILDNRQRGDQHYIKFYRAEGLNIPDFGNEKKYPESQYPSTGLRIVALYRFWNIIEYWYPYKYNLPVSWNRVLQDQVPYFLNASGPEDYAHAIRRLVAMIQDGHGYFLSYTSYRMDGNFYMPVRFKYIEQQIIVSSISHDSMAAAAGLAVGDIVESIDGVKAADIIRQKMPLTAGSNEPYRLYSICQNLNKTTQSTTTLEINDGVHLRKLTVANKFSMQPLNQFVSSFTYQRDSTLSLLKNNIAYLNMGKLLMENDSANLVKMVGESSGLIIDARQNAIEDPNHPNVLGLLEELICNGEQPYVFSTCQPDYAGVFKLAVDTAPPFKPHPVRYNKPVVILINEEAMSIGEFMSMIFSKAPQAVLMGGPTAGADGPASNVFLPGNSYVMFTGTGIYWKDGGETQRVGIKPAITITPTIEGYRKNRDELLDKAIDYLSKEIK
jgi:C-terminal processing protease CtpA/Prc